MRLEAAPEDREWTTIRDATFEAVIVKKRQRSHGEVDEIVLSLYTRGVEAYTVSRVYASGQQHARRYPSGSGSPS